MIDTFRKRYRHTRNFGSECVRVCERESAMCISNYARELRLMNLLDTVLQGSI